jgi:hypothetical protein
MEHNTSTINIITERRSNGEYLGLHTTILEDDKALENALLNFRPTDNPRDIIAITILCSTTTENIDLQPFVTDNRHAALTHHDAINTQPVLAIDICEHIIAIHDDINEITAEFEWTHAQDALRVLKLIEGNRTRTPRETMEKAVKPYPLIDTRIRKMPRHRERRCYHERCVVASRNQRQRPLRHEGRNHHRQEYTAEPIRKACGKPLTTS